jgi:TRAP-type C4-dicarboxylate transport system substrate-binding protein
MSLWRIAACVAAVSALGTAGSGCTGGAADKAGGPAPEKPLVLVMANGNAVPAELQPFVDTVGRLSHRSVQIELRNRWREGEREYEAGIIRDIRAGKADLAWVGSRAWDSVGDTRFDALHAPFLIDSYELEEKVLQGPIPLRMLRSLSPLGLIGLGVLPGPMRKPLAVSRALVAPSEFRGLKIGITESLLARETLHALGAAASAIPSGGPIKGLDGAEVQTAAIYGNDYELSAKYLSANVNLWPRPLVLFMSKRRYSELTPSERTLLLNAAQKAIPAALASVRGLEYDDASALCRRGLRLATARPADLVQLRRAVAPVYARLERERATRSFITSIDSMRTTLSKPSASLPPCAREPTESGSVIPNGRYENTMTRADVRRARVPSGDPIYRQLPTHHTLVLRSGAFFLYDRFPSGRTDVGMSGGYSVYRDRIIFTSSDGEDRLSFRWSFDGSQLRFLDLPHHGGGYFGATFAPPWTKTG